MELVVGFITVILFFIGVARIWTWSNAQMVGRTPAYNQTRIAAGNTHPGFWGPTGQEGVYTPKELTDEWVFRGNPSPGAAATINHPDLNQPTRLNLISNTNLQSNLNGIGDEIGEEDWSSLDISDPAALKAAIAKIEASITDLEDSIATLEDWRDKWQGYYNTATAGISQAERDIELWEDSVEHYCPCTPSEYIDCSNCDAARVRLEIAKNGGRYIWDINAGEYGEMVYDSSQVWTSTWASRAEFAGDYWNCQIAGSFSASENPTVQSEWIAGLSDWQARQEIAETQKDNYQESLDKSNEALAGLKTLKADLEAKLAALS